MISLVTCRAGFINSLLCRKLLEEGHIPEAARFLRCMPKHGFEDGVKITAKWFKEHLHDKI